MTRQQSEQLLREVAEAAKKRPIMRMIQAVTQQDQEERKQQANERNVGDEPIPETVKAVPSVLAAAAMAPVKVAHTQRQKQTHIALVDNRLVPMLIPSRLLLHGV
jgi:hypothetical protein